MLELVVPAMLAVDASLDLVVVENGAGWDAEWATNPFVGPHITATSIHCGYATSGNGGSPTFIPDFTTQVRRLFHLFVSRNFCLTRYSR